MFFPDLILDPANGTGPAEQRPNVNWSLTHCVGWHNLLGITGASVEARAVPFSEDPATSRSGNGTELNPQGIGGGMSHRKTEGNQPIYAPVIRETQA